VRDGDICHVVITIEPEVRLEVWADVSLRLVIDE
jgi:hypothetical protein